MARALFLTTMAVLTLELSLTRLFSVVLFYHYAFLVISMALLGLASGAIFARLLQTTSDLRSHARLIAVICLLAAISILPMLQVILNTNIFLVSTWGAFTTFGSLYLICMIPFGLAGFVISSVMRVGAQKISTLYAYDLLGAACGGLLFVPLINVLGGPNTVLAVAGMWCAAAIAWAVAGGSPRIATLAAVLLAGDALFILLNGEGRILDVRYLRGAPRRNELFTKWNSFSRISVYRDRNNGTWIEIDGGAGTLIPRIDFSGPSGRLFTEKLGRDGADLAFLLSQKPKSLIIGPGGGVDIARALAAGSRSITAVEINPIIARDVMQGRFHAYSYGLYTQPGVRIFIEDGRTFVQRTNELYDVVQMSQVDTWASSASGAYSLTENYLYTVEAIENYFKKLTPGGLVSITRWEFARPRETLRLLAVVLEALDRLQVPRPAEHVMVAMESLRGGARLGTVLVGRRPFTADEIKALRARLAGTPVGIICAPGNPNAGGPFNDLVRSPNRRSFIAAYDYDISPVFDDRPFFFFTGRWRNFWRPAFSSDRSGDALNTGAQFLLLALLIASVIAVCLFLFLPLVLFRQAFPSSKEAFPFLIYALAVGVGFILLEVSLIQKFVIFLGHPVYSITVVIFALLMSSSLGSRLTAAFADEKLVRTIQIAIAGIAGLIFTEYLLIGRVIQQFQGESTPAKIGLVTLMIFPLGLLMGMPFPSGLRLTALSPSGAIEWVWALNAAATVLGSILAIFLAVTLGVSESMLIGGGSYVVAALYARFMRQR
jgi:predicted membrane-bound spermidine synthase